MLARAAPKSASDDEVRFRWFLRWQIYKRAKTRAIEWKQKNG
jgi:hypothetical protein